jgi:streptogramin lyase
MRTISWAYLVGSALVLGPPQPAAAQTAKFRHLVSIYADDQAFGLHLPEGVACGANGEVVVGDTGNGRLVRFTYRDKTVSEGSVIKIPQVSAPSRVHLNSKGEIYALNDKERRIVHLGPEGEFKDVLTFEGAPPPATIIPKSFTIDQADSIYVLDVASARVLVLDAQGKFRRALPFPDDIGFGSDLAVDETGSLILLDSIRRRMFSADKGATAFAPLGGDLSEALATLPTYLMTTKGSIFAVEGRGSSIVSFRRDGSFMARQLTLGWEEGSLNHPSQMCINDKDEVFIADRDNSRIQVFQLIR